MAEEIQEAVQIIRVLYDGVEISMKVGSGGLSAMKQAVTFIKGMLDYEKSMGKTSMRKLLMKGGDLQIMQVPTTEIKQVEKMAKKYGILYSMLPDMDRTDGMTELIFHQEALPRANTMLTRLNGGRLLTFNDYLEKGDEKQLGKLMDFFQHQKQAGIDETATKQLDNLIEQVGLFAMQKKSLSVDAVKENFSINHEAAENIVRQLAKIGILGSRDDAGTYQVILDKDAFLNRVRGYQQLADRIRMVSATKDARLSDVTIAKSLIKEENDHAVKTRVPGTWGENIRYIWLKKENIMEIHNGKTMLTFLDGEKDYKLYDEKNRVVETKKGSALYEGHYDAVEATVRQRYEQENRISTKQLETMAKAAAEKRAGR